MPTVFALARIIAAVAGARSNQASAMAASLTSRATARSVCTRTFSPRCPTARADSSTPHLRR